MTCSPRLVHDHVYGLIDDETVAAHVAACPPCSDLGAGYRREVAFWTSVCEEEPMLAVLSLPARPRPVRGLRIVALAAGLLPLAAVLSLLLFWRTPAQTPAAQDPAKAGSLDEFIGKHKLGAGSVEDFRNAINGLRGTKVAWKVRARSCDPLTSGYTTPDTLEARPKAIDSALFMAWFPVDPQAHCTWLPSSETAVFARCLAGMGSGLNAVAYGEDYVIRGTIWGADPAAEKEDARTFFLKDCAIEPAVPAEQVYRKLEEKLCAGLSWKVKGYSRRGRYVDEEKPDSTHSVGGITHKFPTREMALAYCALGFSHGDFSRSEKPPALRLSSFRWSPRPNHEFEAPPLREIRYTVSADGVDEPWVVTLRFEEESLRPVRRLIEYQNQKRERIDVETYEGLTVDP